MAGYWPRTRPISSHLDRTNLVNKGFIIWLLVKFCLRDTAGSPEQALPARVANHSARFGSSCGASHIIKVINVVLTLLQYLQSFLVVI